MTQGPMGSGAFTPALGLRALTPLYDAAIGLLTVATSMLMIVSPAAT